MTTRIINYYSENIFRSKKPTSLSGKSNGLAQILPEILFITSFPPRECGIATYTQDLVNALNNQFENSFSCSICALENNNEHHGYLKTPKFILNTDQTSSFLKIASQINNNDNIMIVVIQHEFGFFAKNEIAFKNFCNALTKPIVFVFHTVLPNPNVEFRTKVKDMAEKASAIIVMTQNASAILVNDYAISKSKITVIPHGTHLIPQLNREELKKKYQLSNKKVLSTFGLLSSSKSIETTLNALPEVIEKHPEVLFLILGKTHPSLIKHEGEQYREMLKSKIKELNIGENVRFVNEYLQLPVLLEYLQLSDIYLFTSKDPNQAVSGTFSYALSCGCPVISTPIPHALEVLRNNNGILFDFENSEQLTVAIISLLDNEELRAEISSRSLHKMAATAWQNSAIAHTQLFEKLTRNSISLNYTIPAFNFNHIQRMTTEFGFIQFAKIANPDISTGYTIDDNSRALIAICQHYEIFQDPEDLKLIYNYLYFILYCMQPNGKFLNYVNEAKEFTTQNIPENLDDSNGRAIWALGYVLSLKKILPFHVTLTTEYLLEKALPNLLEIHSTRAMAFIIKGLHYQNKKENLYILETLADRMVQMYRHENDQEWLWFEDYMTYGNSLLPEAMLCAYLSTQKEKYKTIAKESFDFLLSKIFVNGSIRVISNKGWHIKDELRVPAIGGEQPIDVAYTIMALEKFYEVFKNKEYKQKAKAAFNWFLGDNHLHQIVYNPCTGGCYDGVEEHNVNLNQGAESTLSYLMARLTIEKMFILASKDLTKSISIGSLTTIKEPKFIDSLSPIIEVEKLTQLEYKLVATL